MSILSSYLDRTKATESGLPKLIEEADMLFSWKQPSLRRIDVNPFVKEICALSTQNTS